MNHLFQACLPDQRLSKSSFLALLESKIDESKAINTSSGEIIDISEINPTIIFQNINNGTWVYYETLLPRRLFLTNPMWEITSFVPKTRSVCIKMYAKSGTRNLNITVPPFWSKNV